MHKKHECRGRILVVFVISLLMILTISFINYPNSISTNILQIPHKAYSTSYTPHDPISISKDGDFEKLGFEGNGTETNPYLIEGLSIHVMFDGIGIYIESTSVYFIIRNCELYSFDAKSGTGIQLEKVKNGVVSGCDIKTLAVGISIIKSEKCGIYTNKLSELGKGVYSTQSIWLSLNHNNLTNSGYGLHLNKIDYSELMANNLDHCNYGILIETSVEIQVLSNQIEGSFFGLYFHNTARSQSENSVIHHSQYGVYYAYSQKCNITSSELTWNKYGASLLEVDGGTISANMIKSNSDYGFHIKNSRDINILANTVFDNRGIGLYLSGVTGAEIHDNEIGYTMGTNAADFVGSSTIGLVNNWDTNAWSNYLGSSNYSISGDRGSLDFDPHYIVFVNSPIDINVEAPANGFVNWSASAFKPSYYSVKMNGVVIEEGYWDGSDISIPFQNLDPGTYSYVVSVTTESGKTTSDAVSVYSVDTTPPEWIQIPEDQVLEYGNPLSYQLHAFDYYGISRWWVNNTEFSINLGHLQNVSTLGYGVYNLEVRVYDSSDNYATYNLQVTVIDSVLPSADSPEDIVFLEGETGNIITWIVFDCNPANYEILKDGVTVESGEWTHDMTIIQYSVDSLSVGHYIFTIILIDIAGNSFSDDVQVTVEEPTTTETPTTTTETPTTSSTPTSTEHPTDTNGALGGPNILTLSLIGIGAGAAIVVILLIIKKR